MSEGEDIAPGAAVRGENYGGAGDVIEVRGTVNGRTYSWAVRLEVGVWLSAEEMPRVRVEGHIIAAGFADHVDRRIDNQRDSIDRLSKHVMIHHERLGLIRAEDCDVELDLGGWS